MLILTYLLRTDLSWQNAGVHLKMVVSTESARQDAHQNLTHLIARLRVVAQPDILVADGRSFEEVLKQESSAADLVILGMAEPEDDFKTYYEQLRTRTDGLPSTLLILAAEEISFQSVVLQQDDDGPQA